MVRPIKKHIIQTANMFRRNYSIPSEAQNRNISSANHEDRSECVESEHIHLYFPKLYNSNAR